MTSILSGVVASGKTGHLSNPIVGSFDALATVTLTSTAASVTFNGIPQNYTHLQLRWTAQDNRAADGDNVLVVYNGDSTQANYRTHRLLGYSGGVLAQDYGNSGAFGEIAGNTNASVFGSTIVDILDYANTSKNKTSRALGGLDNNTNGEIAFYSSVWLNTNAITSIVLSPSNASLFSAYSTFSLYGVR